MATCQFRVEKINQITAEKLKTILGRVFNFKLGRFVQYRHELTAYPHGHF
jgi:hypothetical protein